MQTYKIEKVMPGTGVLTLSQLPFKANETLEIAINYKRQERKISKLRGKVMEYKDPFEPVAEEDWDIFK
mgnify:CR=1 FL=1